MGTDHQRAQVVTNKWLRNVIDLECFVLSGMLAKDTIAAEMAFMFMERNRPGSSIDYPMGGSGALVDALTRGLAKYGGRLEVRAHVDEIVIEDGRAVGVRLRPRKPGGPAEVRFSHQVLGTPTPSHIRCVTLYASVHSKRPVKVLGGSQSLNNQQMHAQQIVIEDGWSVGVCFRLTVSFE
jgi:phytoene dehydrogenase-like protein